MILPSTGSWDCTAAFSTVRRATANGRWSVPHKSAVGIQEAEYEEYVESGLLDTLVMMTMDGVGCGLSYYMIQILRLFNSRMEAPRGYTGGAGCVFVLSVFL